MTDFLSKLRYANFKRDMLYNPEKNISISYRGNELAGEVGELCNKIKKLEAQRLGLPNAPKYKLNEGIKEEIADVLICLDLLCMDLEEVLKEQVILEVITTDKFNSTSIKLQLPTKIK